MSRPIVRSENKVARGHFYVPRCALAKLIVLPLRLPRSTFLACRQTPPGSPGRSQSIEIQRPARRLYQQGSSDRDASRRRLFENQNLSQSQFRELLHRRSLAAKSTLIPKFNSRTLKLCELAALHHSKGSTLQYTQRRSCRLLSVAPHRSGVDQSRRI